MSKGLSYRDAGVDIEAGDALVEAIKPFARRTLRPEVLAGIGGFGALCQIPQKYRHPVLVSGTDGVGTKLKLAFERQRHDTVGIDLVAMSVNDILACGAEPLFFLDYYVCEKLDVRVATQVVEGIAAGCELAGCALIGGETAEHPNAFPKDEYDLAGFALGVVEKERIVDGRSIRPGDVILGPASSGPHSNGYSLIRKILERAAPPQGFDLLEPTRIYVKPVLKLLESVPVKGLAHITGGGLIENVPRVLPEKTRAVIKKASWPRPEVFRWLQREGNVAEEEMQRVFNCGIGMVLVTLGLFAPVSTAWAKKDKLEVTLTAPAAGALYNAPAAVVLSAIAQTKQKNHPIAKVEFFQGANLIGAVAGPRRDDQYTLNWTGVAAGNYAATAKATNDKGDTDLSDPVSITVNALPSVSLTSPGSNSAFTAPANIPLTVPVDDTDGSIANVEYFYGTTLITSLGAPPYSFVWTEVPQGTYALAARVTDNLGASMTSVPVNVTVNAAEAKLYYIHVDHLNTPRLIADDQQRTVWRWDQQEPFGVNVPDENPNGVGTFDLPLRLPGQYFDRETNLAYNFFRDYDAELGRYSQTDIVGVQD